MTFQPPQNTTPHDPSLSSQPAPSPAPAPSARHYPQQQQQLPQPPYYHQQVPSQYSSPQSQHQWQQQQQQIAMMNGMNGTNMAAGMPVPTPAGHQAELNYIYGMVEELSRQLAENRRVTEDIVSGLGRVRNKAKTQGVSNQQVIESAAEDINGMYSPSFCYINLLTHNSKAKNKTLMLSFLSLPNPSKRQSSAVMPTPNSYLSMPTPWPIFCDSSTNTRPSTSAM